MQATTSSFKRQLARVSASVLLGFSALCAGSTIASAAPAATKLAVSFHCNNADLCVPPGGEVASLKLYSDGTGSAEVTVVRTPAIALAACPGPCHLHDDFTYQLGAPNLIILSQTQTFTGADHV